MTTPTEPYRRGDGRAHAEGERGEVIDDDFATVLPAAQGAAEWAVADLYRSHQVPILRYLRAQAPGHEEDLASETWLAAARNLRSFEGGHDDFAGWLFTIAHRRLLDHRRAQRRRPADPGAPATIEARAVSSPSRSPLRSPAGWRTRKRLASSLVSPRTRPRCCSCGSSAV